MNTKANEGSGEAISFPCIAKIFENPNLVLISWKKATYSEAIGFQWLISIKQKNYQGDCLVEHV